MTSWSWQIYVGKLEKVTKLVFLHGKPSMHKHSVSHVAPRLHMVLPCCTSQSCNTIGSNQGVTDMFLFLSFRASILHKSRYSMTKFCYLMFSFKLIIPFNCMDTGKLRK